MKKTARKKPSATRKKPSNGKLRPGEIEAHGQRFSSIMVSLAAEKQVEKHNLSVADGLYQITAEFLQDFTEALRGLGYDVTPDTALEAWKVSAAHVASEQKKTKP